MVNTRWNTPKGRKVALTISWTTPPLAVFTMAIWLALSLSGSFKGCADTPCGILQIIVFLVATLPLVFPLTGVVFIWAWKKSRETVSRPFFWLWSVWLPLAALALVSSWVLMVFELIGW